MKGMEGTMRDLVDVHCTVVSRNSYRGSRRLGSVSGWFRYQHSSNWKNRKYEREVTKALRRNCCKILNYINVDIPIYATKQTFINTEYKLQI